jgi:ABC-type uncharacterized transport system involved in gliding motility auxiliary subunit
MLLRGARMDLTENRLYTLSEGTRRIVATLDEPVNLYLFFSDPPRSDYPAAAHLRQRVRELLEEIASRLRMASVRLQVIDPLPFSEEEDRATAFGLQPVPVGTRGAVAVLRPGRHQRDRRRAVIPFFQPDKEAFLEYDIAKLIQSLSARRRRWSA